MSKLTIKTSDAPFNIEDIITMLADSPQKDYGVIARMVSKLISEDTIDLTDLGNDLTLTDKKQMLGITSNRRFKESDVIQLIKKKGVNSPEYNYALERRLRLTLKRVMQGVKKKRDKEDKTIFDFFIGQRLANFNTWKNRQILSFQDRPIIESIEVKLGSEYPYVEEDDYSTDGLESPEFNSQERYFEEINDCDIPF